MVATTGEGRAGAAGPVGGAVAAVDGALVPGRSATHRPVTTSLASRTRARTTASQRRRGRAGRRAPAAGGRRGVVVVVARARPGGSRSPGARRPGGEGRGRARPPGRPRRGRSGPPGRPRRPPMYVVVTARSGLQVLGAAD